MYSKHVFLTCVHGFLLLAAVFAFFSLCNTSNAAAILTVPDPYPTIQAAINAASAGDTIIVSRRSGEPQSVYDEKLVIDKQLILLGEGRETIIIDGAGTGTVIRIQADGVEINGFTIRNGSRNYSGIRANGYSYITVTNNTIEMNKYGLTLLYSHYNTIGQNQIADNTAAGVSVSDSLGNNISDNIISESAYGLKLTSTNATFVTNNTVADNSYGIYLASSSNDTIDRNTVVRNGVDGILQHASHDIVVSRNLITECAYGLQLYNAHAITVLGNNATDNAYGAYVAFSGPSNTLENNTFYGNDWGIALYSSSGNIITGNTLAYNTYGVDLLTESNNNQFYHNNFRENIEHVVWNPDCINTWDDGYPSGGNYWSDYAGVDANGDGIGDTAYVIDPMNRDRYPLMTPWGVTHDIAIIDVTPSSPKAYVGDIIVITVVAENQGTETETFNVTVTYENTTLTIFGVVGIQQVVDLAPQENATLMFSWNTADAQPCVYHTISAEATVVSGETDTADNIYVDGTVKVKLPGDITGDGKVDIADLSIVSLAFGAYEGEPEYNPEADLIKDGIVDTRDIVLVCRNYGRSC